MLDTPQKLFPEPTAKPNRDAIRILHVVPFQDFQWIIPRSQHALGPNFKTTEAVGQNLNAFTTRMLHHKPPIVFIHALSIRSKTVIAAAIACPKTQFVNITHSNQNHLITWPEGVKEHAKLLHETNILPNLHVASPDAYSPWPAMGYRQTFVWPNPILLPQDPGPKTPSQPTIAIISRPDLIKALPSQITAARLLQLSHKARVYLTLALENQNNPALLSHAQSLQIKLHRQPWMEIRTLWHWLNSRVSVLFQASYAETFNYLTIDAASCHVPFVGSYAIRHCPEPWKVQDPNNSHEIAATAARILDDFPAHQKLARPLAEAVAKRNNALYAWHVKRILGLEHSKEPPADINELEIPTLKPT